VTTEDSPVRKALTAVVLAVALFAAVVIQLTAVNRLPLPGATAPDLVLLLVTAIAVTTSPTTGAVVGFAGGLALDVAPPAAHYAGEYALVFCLAGYAAARVVRAIRDRAGEHDTVTTFTVMAAAAAAGEASKAVLGMLLSDPDVTGAVVSRVLPGAILSDILLSPLAFWLVARGTRGAVGWSTAPERAPAPEFGRAGQLASVFRQASAGAAPVLFAPRKRLAGSGGNYGSPSLARRVPKLRLAGTGGNYGSPSLARRVPKLRLAGSGEKYGSPSLARRVPKLRLSGARSASSRRTSAAGTPGAPLSLAGGRTPRLNFAGNLPARAARSTARTPGKNWLRSAPSSAVPAAKRAARSPSRGWLSSAGAGGRGDGLTGGRTRARPRRFGSGIAGTAHAAGSPISARPARSAAEALAARSAPSGLSALSGAGTPLASRRSPHAGWLRTPRGVPAPQRQQRSPRSGWLGSASRPRTVIGRTVTGRPGPRSGALRSGARGGGATFRRNAFRGRGAARGNWYAASPSGAWLRRGRHPWRKRSYLPGGRPPVPPGARAMAKTGTISRARKPRLFGLLGGRR
jgi:rod shape-determining protein MreD